MMLGAAAAVRQASLWLLVLLVQGPAVGRFPLANLTEPFNSLDAVFETAGLGELFRGVFGESEDGREAALVLLLLADQALACPDYRSIGRGGMHPTSRHEYRDRTAIVFVHPVVRERQARSHEALLQDAAELVQGGPGPAAAAILMRALAREISADSSAWGAPSVGALRSLLEAELLMPLRALREIDILGPEWSGQGLEPLLETLLGELIQHIVQGDFREWVYQRGAFQLEGLSPEQLQQWVELSAGTHMLSSGRSIRTREEDGIEMMWATKIGGPSHGFDFQTRCLLPLVCNARHKVILIEDVELWPHNAVARSHLRLLHRATDRQPVLHLEPVQTEFPVESTSPRLEYHTAVIRHAMAKADSMGLPLLLGESFDPTDPPWHPEAKAHPALRETVEQLLLMPSNGIFEASDSLSRRHDWPQLEEEVTEPLVRWTYTPTARR